MTAPEARGEVALDATGPFALEAVGLALANRRRRIGPFDLAVHVGEVVGLIGANGSGKTSCLRLALGLDPATTGTARVHGVPVSPWRPPRGVGLVLEADGCYPWLSGRDNLQVFAGALGRSAGEVEAQLVDAGLGAAADRAVRTYSRGMRQRLAIARAGLGDPPLLVLDEPTVALDESATAWLVGRLAVHARSGGSVLVASHDPDFLDQLGARRVVVDAGTTR